MVDRAYRDEEWLREKYVDEGLNSPQIGEMCGVSQKTVTRWLRKHDIETRGPNRGVNDDKPRPYTERDWLYRKYVMEGKSMYEIADEVDRTDMTIRRWLDRHGIERRSMSDSAKLRWEKRSEAEKEREVEKIVGYLEENNWHNGESNPNYIDGRGQGRSYGPEWPKARKKAIERDGGECVSCGSRSGLHVHHHIPVRMFEESDRHTVGDAHQLWNLTTLCNSCHMELEAGRRFG